MVFVIVATHAAGGSTTKEAETQAEAEAIAQTLLDHGVKSSAVSFDAVVRVQIAEEAEG